MIIYKDNFIFYVYAYLKPNGKPYYIGKGKEKRAYDKRHKVFVPKMNHIVFLEKNLSEIGAFALERRYIEWYGRLDINTGVLENKTHGGDGTSGFIQSEEHKSKRKLFERGNKIGQLNKGIRKTELHKEKLRIVNTGKTMSVESSEKKRKSMIGKVSPNKNKIFSDTWRNNMSVLRKGKSKSVIHSKNLGTHLNNLPNLSCPHCGREGRMAPMKRWHFENCKMKNI